jgi:hypothetical protein
VPIPVISSRRVSLITASWRHGSRVAESEGRSWTTVIVASGQRKIVELWSDVSLTAELFFAKRGFVVEARKTVQVRGIAMANARMRKHLRRPL